jgi:small GTP-binding protein
MVGKSSLTYRFINYNTPLDHDATIEDKYKTVVEIDGLPCEIGILLVNKLEILDTAGQDDYQNMLDMWIIFAEGFLLVFAVNDRESFDCLTKKRDRVLKLKKGSICPIVLVGNKCDLQKERSVSEAEAKELARTWNADYIETSAVVNKRCII